jgi:5-methylcytosine-specific restriction protein A
MRNFQFDEILKHYFNATKGAGSLVTEKDEANKRQITVTNRFERPIFEEIFKDIKTGKKEDLGDDALKTFRLFPDGRQIHLPLMYVTPTASKPKRNELRLYMNKGAFRPKANDFWFVFLRDGEIWLGVLSPEELDRLKAGEQIDLQDGLDATNEAAFQKIANDKAPLQKVAGGLRYMRDPSQAQEAIKAAAYKCEVRPDLQNFMSRSSGNPYVEAHHLVPMFYQKYLTETNIDTSENICCLSPFVHRMLHYGLPDDIKGPLELLCEKRKNFLERVELKTADLLKIYGVI